MRDLGHTILASDRATVREYQDALEQDDHALARRIWRANPDLQSAFAFVEVAHIAREVLQ